MRARSPWGQGEPHRRLPGGGGPWTTNEYAGPPLTGGLVRAAEAALGCTLPAAYLDLLRVQNGGLPRRRWVAADRRRVELTGLYGVGGWYGVDDPDRGSRAVTREWGYPAAGVVVAPTPSAGHEVVMLDYGGCGPAGDPRVVHVVVEGGAPVVTVLAPDFASFVAALRAGPQ